jgi:hypothetical protein
MGLAWQAYGLGHLAKSIHGYYVVYRNFDNEMKTNRWFAKNETGSDRLGEQANRIGFQGFDNLKDAQAFCEKNARDVERALRVGSCETGLITNLLRSRYQVIDSL